MADEVLRGRIIVEVERRMDLEALETVRASEDETRRRLVQALVGAGGARENCGSYRRPQWSGWSAHRAFPTDQWVK
jgi:hypothetical protein